MNKVLLYWQPHYSLLSRCSNDFRQMWILNLKGLSTISRKRAEMTVVLCLSPSEGQQSRKQELRIWANRTSRAELRVEEWKVKQKKNPVEYFPCLLCLSFLKRAVALWMWHISSNVQSWMGHTDSCIPATPLVRKTWTMPPSIGTASWARRMVWEHTWEVCMKCSDWTSPANGLSFV